MSRGSVSIHRHHRRASGGLARGDIAAWATQKPREKGPGEHVLARSLAGYQRMPSRIAISISLLPSASRRYPGKPSSETGLQPLAGEAAGHCAKACAGLPAEASAASNGQPRQDQSGGAKSNKRCIHACHMQDASLQQKYTACGARAVPGPSAPPHPTVRSRIMPYLGARQAIFGTSVGDLRPKSTMLPSQPYPISQYVRTSVGQPAIAASVGYNRVEAVAGCGGPESRDRCQTA